MVEEADGVALKGPIAKFLSDGKQDEFKDVFGMSALDTVFFIADAPKVVDRLAGAIRAELGSQMDLIDKNAFEFCFVTDYPMYELDEDTKTVVFTHNPFSMPQGGLEAVETMDPLAIKAHQYDIVCNGIELSSGAIRCHDPAILARTFAIAGYTQQDMEEKFGALFDAMHYGAPPHGGMAPGIDRIVMLLADADNIRDVIPFPMNGNAQDLMMNAPSEVTEAQLREIHIRVRA
jgi:aspartyl-tRNA synthetase